MTELTTTIRPPTEAAVEPSPAAAAAAASQAAQPALITEQQVLFSTAAAVAVPAKTRRWTDAFWALAAAVRMAAGPPEPVRRHHSERYAYLEKALMSREMDRL